MHHERLIIFNCDGVLVDSEGVSNEIEAEEYRKLGYSVSLDESIKKFTGMNSRSVGKIIFDESGIEAALAANMNVIGFTGGSHAQSEWYREKLRAYNIPIAQTSHEIISIMHS